jgi:EAL domain-containing protein (putative c-di-GMP-specific phosphodiesterase class I)
VVGAPPNRVAAPEAILGAVSALGSALGLQVLAEGVETVEQVDRARRVGCTFAQGYQLSRPLVAEHLSGLLEDSRRLTGRQTLPSRSTAD